MRRTNTQLNIRIHSSLKRRAQVAARVFGTVTKIAESALGHFLDQPREKQIEIIESYRRGKKEATQAGLPLFTR